MSEIYCEGCGHHFPSRKEGVVDCPHCGRPKHVHGAIPCPNCSTLNEEDTSFCEECGAALFKMCEDCEARRPANANYCSICGSSLVDREFFARRKEKREEELELQRQKSSLAKILVAGALITAAWFFCVSPVLGQAREKLASGLEERGTAPVRELKPLSIENGRVSSAEAFNSWEKESVNITYQVDLHNPNDMAVEADLVGWYYSLGSWNVSRGGRWGERSSVTVPPQERVTFSYTITDIPADGWFYRDNTPFLVGVGILEVGGERQGFHLSSMDGSPQGEEGENYLATKVGMRDIVEEYNIEVKH